MNGTAGMDELRTAIGREERHREAISPGLAQRYLDTLAAGPELGLMGIQWCLAPPSVPVAETGPDGHPRKGQFLPAVPLPRRMWAGGSLTFHDDLRVGDDVERVSRIADISMKEGRSGALCFVAVEHSYETTRGVALRERHDIVYRAAAAPVPLAGVMADDDRPGDVSLEIEASSLLLFRYSALTFNGHRIHYDRDYAMREEFYPGLVVHGPLQATFAMRLAASLDPGRRPARFAFRGVSPLIDGGCFRVRARRTAPDAVALHVIASDGRLTTTADMTW